MNLLFALAILLATSLIQPAIAAIWPRAFIDLKTLPTTATEYCHVVVFPQGWKIPPVDDDGEPLMIDYSISDYEFRLEGLLGTWFLAGAFKPDVLPHRYDATNHYRLNLSDNTAPVLPASRTDWNAATILPLVRKSLFTSFGMHPPDDAVFNGFHYKKSGESWSLEDSAMRLSPDSAWLVLQSVTKVKSPILDKYLVFFDIFNTDTGRKVFTLQGTYSGIGDPYEALGKAAWLTERYFIIPLGKRRERCLVCEFITHNVPGAKP